MRKKTNKKNRLTSLFGNFADKFELPHKPDLDGRGADLGIPYDNKTITVGYNFDPSEDSYEFGAALGKVDPPNIPTIANEVVTSASVRGITERINHDGKFVILGSRDSLTHIPDGEIQRGFMDDVSRVTEAYDQFKGFFKK
jgi:hypothetical protein